LEAGFNESTIDLRALARLGVILEELFEVAD
jgi:hypothetical protein